ncbi:hypothetical protein LEP1GSC064_2782, partial [Leptospira kirschneri serovar Grippotyphosa str. Moskva]
MSLFRLLKINSNIKILLSIFMISILFSCKDKHGSGIESWFVVLNPVQSDSKAISERHHSSNGTLTFA